MHRHGGGVSLDFYQSLNGFDDFRRVVDPSVYRRLPDDWAIALTDVVKSTEAIAAGRYKAVNMAGAAGISALVTVSESLDLPFIFGGDGCAIAVPPTLVAATRDALAATSRWVEEELDLGLRVALVPCTAIRQAGADILVAPFALSPHIRTAAFAGGGLSWAEDAMKRGAFLVDPAPPGTAPNLDNLSCRWTPVVARRGVIASIIIKPEPAVAPTAFADAVASLLAVIADDPRSGHPIPESGPGFRWPPEGLTLEAKASRRGKSLVKRLRTLRLITLIAWILDRTGLKIGAFDPRLYKRDTALNTDFRKFDDGLKMTVDCADGQLAEIEGLLTDQARQGVIRYGLHTQTEAVLTCIVPSPLKRQHIHFLDGAGGGYAFAARQLKVG